MGRVSKNDLINLVPDNNIDEKIWENVKNKLSQNEKTYCDAKIKNTDRADGTKLSH